MRSDAPPLPADLAHASVELTASSTFDVRTLNIKYTVSDGAGGTATGTTTINVVNTAPVASTMTATRCTPTTR